MSREIDERIVSMQFNNKNFEKNVGDTMKSLDNLDKKLRLKGASKGLEAVGKATKTASSNVTGVGKAVEAVSLKFSAMQVIGVTALTRITNQAIATGERMLKALTLDPVTTGFKEYETQINAVQTILANTSSKGTTIDHVNAALDELNRYADKTIYNFTEMTRNIGTFTAAGVNLDTSVSAIQGIANLAAVSGSTSQQASTAMYQLSQALAAGRVSLMDWNSVVNAGMGGEVFQNALKRTSEVMGTGAEDAIKKYGSFRESLTQGEWLTTDVLTETLKQFTMAAEEGSAEWQKFKAELKEKGYTDAQAEEILKMANTATDAATKVKTFSQLWDVLKEAAQSGWAQTWEIIVGDFEEAKALLTPLADFFTNVINKVSESRNKLLESALGRSVSSMFKNISTAVEAVSKPVTKVTEALESLDAIAEKVIGGTFGNGEERFAKLTELGYNYCTVQNKVNEKLNNSYRYTKEQIEAQDKLLGKQTKTVEKTEEQTKETTKLTDAQKDQLKVFSKMTEEQALNAGYTKEQIAAMKELGDMAKRLGIPMDEFIDKMDEINGRWLLINAFKNIGNDLVESFTAIKKTWEAVFPPKSIEERATSIFNLIGKFHELTTRIDIIDDKTGGLTDTGKKLARTFAGIFSALDIVVTLVSGPLKIGFKILTQLLGAFDLNILDVTAVIGDAIVKLRQWLDSILDFSGIFEKIAPSIKKAIRAVKDWINGLKKSDNVAAYIGESVGKAIGALVNGIKNAISTARDFIQNGFTGAGGDFVSGFIGGLKSWFGKAVDAVMEFGSSCIKALKTALDSHSPSKKTHEEGVNAGEGFLEGLIEVAKKIWDWLKGFGQKVVDLFGAIDFGKVFALLMGGGIAWFAYKIGTMISAIASPLEGLGDVLENAADTVKIFNKSLKNLGKAVTGYIKAQTLKSIAIAIAILAASVVVLSLVPPAKLWNAVGVIVALAAVMGGLAAVLGKFGPEKLGELGALTGLLAGLAAALLLMGLTIKLLGSMDENAVIQGTTAIGALVLMIGVLIGITKFAGNVDKLGGTLFKITLAMGMLLLLVKIIGGMDPDAFNRGMEGVIALGLVVAGLVAISQLAGNDVDKIGGTIFKIGLAMALMAVTAKIMAGMDPEEFKTGLKGVIALGLVVSGLIWITKFAGKDADKIGGTILKISLAIAILALTAKIICSMEWGEMGKAAVGLVVLGGIITGLIAATRLAGDKELKRVGATLLMISVAIGILGGVAILLGLIDLKTLGKGLAVVSWLSLIMAGLIYVTKDARNVNKVVMSLAIAIGVIAASVAALSFIDPTSLASATTALTILMGMFAVMIKTTSQNGKHINKSMATLLVMSAAMAVMAGMIILISTLAPENALPSAAAISVLMLSMSAAMAVLAQLGPKAELAVPAAMALAKVIGILGLLVVAIGGVMALLSAIGATEYIKQGLTDFMDLFVIIADGLGRIISGFAVGLVSGLPAIGESLSLFAEKIDPFITSMKSIDDKVLVGIGIISAAILALTAANIVDAIGAFLNGGDSFSRLGTELSTFMTNAQGFITNAANVKPEMAAGIKTLAEAIMILTAANVVDGIARWITGGGTLAEFSAQLGPLGTSLGTFATNLGTFDDATVTTIKCAAAAIKVLADAAATIPNEGGLWGALAGDNSLASFSTSFGNVGTSLRSFVDNLGTFTEDQVTTVQCAGEAIKALATAAGEIPNEGGVWGWLAGENSLATFAESLPGVGTALAGFATNVGTFTDAQVKTVDCAGKAIKALAEASKDIPNEGGVWGWLAGDSNLGDFADDIKATGTALRGFVDELGEFSTAEVNSVNSGANAIKALASLAGCDLDDAADDMDDFSETLPGLATAIKEFATECQNTTGFYTATNKLNKILDIIDRITSDVNTSVETFNDNLCYLATYGITEFTNTFSEKNLEVSDVGAKLITTFIEGAESELKSITASFEDLAKEGKTAIRDTRNDYYAAGKYVVKGFVAGIDDYIYLATDAGTDLGEAALEAAKEALREASPSKAFYEVGEYGGIGFVNALNDSIPNAYNAAYLMGDSATSGLRDTLSRIGSVLDSGVDINPVISPVLDLSDVRSGANAITRMLSMGSSIGVLTNVGAINATMNRRLQNGGNDDVIRAIDRLGSGLADLPGGNSYYFGDISASGDEELNAAIQTIIRYAQIERRV